MPRTAVQLDAASAAMKPSTFPPFILLPTRRILRPYHRGPRSGMTCRASRRAGPDERDPRAGSDPMVTSDPQSRVIERARARLGQVLREKWRLDDLLGVGGMGAVYAATHRTGSRVAIKMLHVEQARDEDSKRRFLREGYVANSVAHPGAVRILDDDVADDGAVFFVMD